MYKETSKCCGAKIKIANQVEYSLGVPVYYCSNCGKPFEVAEQEEKHICCDGECNHDDCCGKIEENCPNFRGTVKAVLVNIPAEQEIKETWEEKLKEKWLNSSGITSVDFIIQEVNQLLQAREKERDYRGKY